MNNTPVFIIYFFLFFFVLPLLLLFIFASWSSLYLLLSPFLSPFSLSSNQSYSFCFSFTLSFSSIFLHLPFWPYSSLSKKSDPQRLWFHSNHIKVLPLYTLYVNIHKVYFVYDSYKKIKCYQRIKRRTLYTLEVSRSTIQASHVNVLLNGRVLSLVPPTIRSAENNAHGLLQWSIHGKNCQIIILSIRKDWQKLQEQQKKEGKKKKRRVFVRPCLTFPDQCECECEKWTKRSLCVISFIFMLPSYRLRLNYHPDRIPISQFN